MKKNQSLLFASKFDESEKLDNSNIYSGITKTLLEKYKPNKPYTNLFKKCKGMKAKGAL